MNLDKLLTLVLLLLSLFTCSFEISITLKFSLYKVLFSLYINLLNFLNNFTFSLNVAISVFPPFYPLAFSVYLDPLISDLEFDSLLHYWTSDSDRFPSNCLCFQKIHYHITWKYHLSSHFLSINFFLFLLWVG